MATSVPDNDFFTLPNEARIRVRSLRPCEEGPIRELFDRLSLRTRYLRFLSPLRELPDSLLQLLASVDDRRQLALVAEYETGVGREVVGLGNFGAVDDQHVEVALVVQDDWQGQRIGTELAVRILEAAEQRGFHRFVAHVAAGNVPIRKILARVGEVVSAKVSGGVSELAFVRRRAVQPAE